MKSLSFAVLFLATSAPLFATDVVPTVLASVHDQPMDGVGDSFNSSPFQGLLRKGGPTQEDRAIQEFPASAFAGSTVTSAVLDGLITSNNAFDVGVRTFEFRLYAGNGTADLSNFSQNGIVVGTASYHPPLVTSLPYSFDVTSAAQTLISGGATWIGLQVRCTSDPNYPNVLDLGTSVLHVQANAFTGTVQCPGDGVLAACPCGNASPVGTQRGCLSSLGVGAALRGTGAASLSGDTFRLLGSELPTGPGLYFQGTSAIAAGAGVTFGDGLRCAGGTIIRLGVRNASGGASEFPAPAATTVSSVGLVLAPGTTRVYQLWYRDAVPFCQAATFNLTNGWQVTWGT